ncbi:MAG: hypothetical protein M1829_002139 [Trizodia sp. TS-e1964]|nr:MAG: hypothetical protein M1829_002139 [Trizodia sp. TS-e1964]
MLGAFVTHAQRDLLLSWSELPEANLYRNHWLLNKVAADAFSQGDIHLKYEKEAFYGVKYTHIGGKRPILPTQDEASFWRRRLIDHSNSGFDTPSPDLLDIHFCFAKAIKWINVAAVMAKIPRPGPRQGVRHFYSGINWTRLVRPGDDVSPRTPFRLYLKHGPFVRRLTSIPVPLPIDLMSTREHSYLVTSRIGRERVGLCIDLWSDHHAALLVDDMRQYVAELRALKKTVSPENGICSTSGEGLPGLSHLIRANRAVPRRGGSQ